MSSANKKGREMFFALLVMFMFFLLPVCEAQVIAPDAGAGVASKQAGLAAGADTAAFTRDYSRKDAIKHASFAPRMIDPVTSQNLKQAGIGPPPHPPPVEIPLPNVPAIFTMNERQTREFADKALKILPAREESYDSPVEQSPLVQQLNKEQEIFDTPVAFSNIDEKNACVMPGIPGAEVSLPGVDTSSVPLAGAGGPSRPGGLGGGMSEFIGAPSGKEGGGGGGEDNSPAAAYGAAKERLNYLQTITTWASDTKKDAQAMMAGIVEFLEDPQTEEENSEEELASLKAVDWRKMADVMEGAWNGLVKATNLYAVIVGGTFKKITNALLDKSGKGAGSLLYEYDGLRHYCKDASGCNDVLLYKADVAKTAAELENIKAQIDQVKLDTSLTSAERKQKKQELEKQLKQAEFNSNMAKQGIGEKDLKRINELYELHKDPSAVEKEKGELEKKKEQLIKEDNELALKSDKTEEDKKREKEIDTEVSDINIKLDDLSDHLDTIKMLINSGPENRQKAESWLKNTANVLHLNTGKDAEIYLGWQKFDNDLKTQIGQSSKEGKEATGLFGVFEDLKDVAESAKEFLSDERNAELSEHLKDYTERLDDLNDKAGTKEDGKKNELEQHAEDSKKDGSTKEDDREHKEKQAEAAEEAADLAGDMAKDFKEIINDLAKKTQEELSKWWKGKEESGGEVPGGKCRENAPTVCSPACPKAFYGKQEIMEDEALGGAPSAAGQTGSPVPAPALGAPMPGGSPSGGFGVDISFNKITGSVAAGGGSGAGGSKADCVKGEKCPQFPKPSEGEGDGGAPPEEGGVPDLEAAAGGAAGGRGAPDGGAFESDGEKEDPEKENDEEKENAETERKELLDKIAKEKGLTSLPGSLEGVYKDEKGNEYIVDALGTGFILATEESIDKNNKAADEVEKAEEGLTKATKAAAPPVPEGPEPFIPFTREVPGQETPMPTTTVAPTPSAPAPTGAPGPPTTTVVPTPTAPPAPTGAPTPTGVPTPTAPEVSGAPTPTAAPAPVPPSVKEAQDNFDNAKNNYDQTVAIPFTSQELLDYEILTREVTDKVLSSVTAATETRAPDPDSRDPPVQDNFDNAANEELKRRVNEAKEKFKDAPENVRNAEMQKVYESMIEFGTPEGDAVESASDELAKGISSLSNSLDSYFNNLQGSLAEANKVADEYSGYLTKNKAHVQELKQGLDRLQSSRETSPERIASNEIRKQQIEKDIARSQESIKEYAEEGNSKLSEIKQKIDKAKKDIEKAKKDVIDKFDKLADMKRNAPGLKEHLSKDGKPTDKGAQFNALKAAEKAAFNNKFSKDAMGSLKDMLAGLPGAHTVAGAAAPRSLDDTDFPVGFDANGNLVERPIHEFVPDEITKSATVGARRIADYHLRVEKTMLGFKKVMEVMKIKGNKLTADNFASNRLKTIKQAVDGGMISEDLPESSLRPGQSSSPESSAGKTSRMQGAFVAITGKDIVERAEKHVEGTGLNLAGLSDALASGFTAIGNFLGFVGSSAIESSVNMLSIEQGKKISKATEQRIKAISDLKKALEQEIATTENRIKEIKEDIDMELKDFETYGFPEYRMIALGWSAEQVSDEEFFKALNNAKKAIEDLKNLRDTLQENYDSLRDDQSSEAKKIWDEVIDSKTNQEFFDEYKAKKDACADEECRSKLRRENIERIIYIENKLIEINEKYDPLVKEAKERLDAYREDPEIDAALTEIKELINNAVKHICEEDANRLKKERLIAEGKLKEAIEYDRSWGLKTISFMETGWGLLEIPVLRDLLMGLGIGFEKIDRKANEESAKISEALEKGAEIFNNLQEELVKRGHNIDELLAKVEWKKDISWKNVDGSNADDVKEWINDVNDKLGLKGKNRIDISDFSDEELRDLGLYWDNFGNAYAKMVDGSFTQDDLARGYYQVGSKKHSAGDLEGAERDLGYAKKLGFVPDETGGHYSEYGNLARDRLEEVKTKNVERTALRMVADVVLDPLNYISLGATAIIKLKKIETVGAALNKAKNFAKTITEGTGFEKAINLGGKILDKGTDILKGNTPARKNIRNSENLLNDLRRSKNSAEVGGDLRLAEEFAEEIRNAEKNLDILRNVDRETNFWTKQRKLFGGLPDAEKSINSFGGKITADLDQADDFGKTLNDMSKEGGLLGQFDDLKDAGDILKKAGKGKFPAAVKKLINEDKNALKNDFYKFNRAFEKGDDIGGVLRDIKNSQESLENSIKIADAYAYNNLGVRLKRGFTTFSDNFAQMLGISPKNSEIIRAKNFIQDAESNLGNLLDVYRKRPNLLPRQQQEIIDAWTNVKKANQGLDDIKRAALGIPKRGHVSAVFERPAPVAEAPRQSADDLLKRLDELAPDEAARRAEKAGKDAKILENEAEAARWQYNQAIDDFKRGRIDLDDLGRSARRKDDAEAAVRNAAERAKAVEKPKAPEVPVRIEERPAVAIPKEEVPAVPKEIKKITPEDSRVKLLDEAGIKEERFTTYRVETDKGLKPATNDEIDNLLREKLGLGDDYKISDEFRKSSVEAYGDELGMKSYDQVRFKKGNQWIPEDEAMDALGQRVKTRIDSALEEGSKATRQAYNDLADDLNKLNRQAGFEENWRVVVEADGKPVIYFAERRIGTMDDITKTPEGQIFGSMVKKHQSNAYKSAFGEVLEHEEAVTLYEGQQLRLKQLRQKAADLRAQGKFDEAAELNTKYRKLAMEEDALFDVKTKFRVETERLAVPQSITEQQAEVVKAIHSAKGDEVVRAVGDDVGSRLTRMMPEDDAKNLGNKLAEGTKEICSCPTTIDGVREKIRQNVREVLEKNPELLAKNNLKLTDDFVDELAGEIMHSKAKQFGVGEEMLAEVLQDAKITPDEVEVFALGKSLVGTHADEAGEFAADARRLEEAVSAPPGRALPAVVERPATPQQLAAVEKNEAKLKAIAKYENELVGSEEEFVYQAIRPDKLETLAKENRMYGIRSGDTIKKYFDKWVDTFSDSLPENLKAMNLKRENTFVYANPSDEISDEILQQIGLSNIDYAVTKFKINPDTTIVVDNKLADQMAKNYEKAATSEKFKAWANEYWSSAVNYRDFKKYYVQDKGGVYVLKEGAPAHLKKEIVPEVLVFEPKQLSDVGLAKKPKRWIELLRETGADSASEALKIKETAVIEAPSAVPSSAVDKAADKFIPGLTEKVKETLPARQSPGIKPPASAKPQSMQDMIAEVKQRLGIA